MNLRSSVPRSRRAQGHRAPWYKASARGQSGRRTTWPEVCQAEGGLCNHTPLPHPTPTSYKGASFSRPWLVRGEQVWGGRLSPTLFPTQPGAC